MIIGLVLYSLTILVRAVLRGSTASPRRCGTRPRHGVLAAPAALAVELPLALPVLIGGLRIATVSTVALVTIGTIVGSGGLGDLIATGLSSNFKAQVLTASVLCVVLALVLDLLSSGRSGCSCHGAGAGGLMGWFGDVIAWFSNGANWQGPTASCSACIEHIGVSAAALGIACVLGRPLALWLGHVRQGGGSPSTSRTSGGGADLRRPRASSCWPRPVRPEHALDPRGAGDLRDPADPDEHVPRRAQVDPATVDTARGMGMSGPQVLAKVELPLAVPLLMDGVRLAAVQVIATATIAALVAAAASEC